MNKEDKYLIKQIMRNFQHLPRKIKKQYKIGFIKSLKRAERLSENLKFT